MTTRGDKLEKEFADAGIRVKHVPADPKAPVQIQIGGRPAAPNPKQDND